MRVLPHVVLTVAVAQLTSSQVDAQELRLFDYSRFYNGLRENSGVNFSDESESAGDSGSDTTDFQLGENGVVISSGKASPSHSDATSNRLVSYNGNENAERQLTPVFKVKATPKLTYSSSLSTNQENTGECGPSPMTPSDIETLVSRSAARYGVDPDFAKAIAWTESRFDQRRNSPKGAHGPMQLIPETAQRFGVADICNPAANIDGGMRYLRSLIDQFGNPLLAAAAYNAGEQRIYQHHGVPPFAETVRYVADVVNYQLGLRAPDPPARPVKPQQQPKPSQTIEIPDVIGATRPAKFVDGVMQF